MTADMTTTEKHRTSASGLRRRAIIVGGIGLCILAAGFTAAYILYTSRSIEIDTATISAPLIDLAPTASGRLDAIYVNAGDTLGANAPVALVGTQVVKTKVAGLIVNIQDTVGAHITAGESVVTMIEPSQLRVVGKIDENKGLAQIQVGDPATFTVDAFGTKVYQGVVDEIAPTSEQSDVVFDISDQRPTNQFAVYVRFDPEAYPELKNGMSARIWVHR